MLLALLLLLLLLLVFLVFLVLLLVLILLLVLLILLILLLFIIYRDRDRRQCVWILRTLPLSLLHITLPHYTHLTSASTHSESTTLTSGKQLSIYAPQTRPPSYPYRPWDPSPLHRNHCPSQTRSPSQSSSPQSHRRRTTNTDSTDWLALP